ncbi:butyrate kinase [Clostridium sp. Cult2]|uniref:butyrate kinase n=1 Tax=Clostridium sp. Cult2 TaxID=2079003 RepID=UPI001F02C8B6|nr:butyrate kinase [Clostridium sp. Cult2]MCF6464929.1 butyrate kinase [Clostridium sp. Cult2]
MYKILVINLGSTSTKIAYYEDNICMKRKTIEHPSEETRSFSDIFDQIEYRKKFIEKFIEENNIDKKELDAIVSRGGHTEPIEGGIYRVNEEMLRQQASGLYGFHPSDLGSKIAYEICLEIEAIPLIVDSPVTDEFEPEARLSGHPLMSRKSSFHVLNHKATAKRYAREKGVKYEDLNLIVAHLGGGISVAPHKNGRMIDGDNALAGDGAFSTNRTGALPVGKLVDICFSGEYTYEEVKRMIQGEGGLVAYLGINDVRIVEQIAKTDEKAALCLNSMIYQISKQIGAMATVLKGKVDAILLTGGIANSNYIVDKIKERCSFIGPIVVYPGENEMEALARGALEGLRGEETIRDFESTE